MKSLLIGTAVVILLAVTFAPQAEASAFMTITVGASSATCNNSLAITATNCGAGFTTVANANTITFSGTVGGYTLGGTGGVDGVQLTSNQPGNSALAQVADTKTQIIHVSGADPLQIDFGVSGFTQPLGNGTLSATHSGTLTTGTSGQENFLGWERNDNALNPGPTGATAVSTTLNCIFPAAAPPVQACFGPTNTLGAPTVTSPFAITGREIITTAIGSQTQWTATIALTATTPPQIPEPSTLLLLGTGMLFLAGRGIRNRRK